MLSRLPDKRILFVGGLCLCIGFILHSSLSLLYMGTSQDFITPRYPAITFDSQIGKKLPISDLLHSGRKYNHENHKLCVIVPFRESEDNINQGKGRTKQLELFLEYMPRFFKSTDIHNYEIIVTEQTQGYRFNKGAIMNAAFAMSFHSCDYFAFHDVDLLPLSLTNRYTYPTNPRRQISSVKDHYLSETDLDDIDLTDDHLGGVLMTTNDQYVATNGYSNAYWGWGFEDADVRTRILMSGFNIDYAKGEAGVYRQLPHERVFFGDHYSTLGGEARWGWDYSSLLRDGFVNHQAEGLRSLDATLVKVLKNAPKLKHFVFEIHSAFGRGDKDYQ